MSDSVHALAGLKVALVHDWLVSRGGGEQALHQFHRIFPDAPIYTLVYDEERAPEWCRTCDIRTSYIQKWPGAKSHHKLLLSFMPKAWEAFDLSGYDLVLSSCSSCCKGVITGPETLHVCYCHSPIRYVWDLYYDYLERASLIRRVFMKRIIPKIRIWDFEAAQRPDLYIANSDFVGKRIAKYYRRDSITIYNGPDLDIPVDVQKGQGYYLVVSRFVGYKRIDLAIEACNRLGRRLIVVGSGGEEEGALRKLAGPAVEFRGPVSDEELFSLYAGADAFLFPGIEDYGLTPLEAMAHGVPVIAYGCGGVTETVMNGKTGHFFHEQTSEALMETIQRFEDEGVSFTRQQIAAKAKGFSGESFREQILQFCVDGLASRHYESVGMAVEEYMRVGRYKSGAMQVNR